MEIKDLFKAVGAEVAEGAEPTLEAFTAALQSHYVPISEIERRTDIVEPIISKKIGQRLGALTSTLIKNAKELGLEISHKDFEGKPLEEVQASIFDGITKRLDEIKKAANTDPKAAAEIERWKTEFKGLNEKYEELSQNHNQLIQDSDAKIKQFKVDHIKSEDWKGLKISPQVDEYKRLGFETKFYSKYDIAEVDGTFSPVYKDGEKKGSRVMNPKEPNKPLTHAQLLEIELAAADMLAKPHESKPGTGSNGKPGGSGEGDPGKRSAYTIPANPRFGVGSGA